ncbi:hypothetical protein [uncultured Sulfitobacter sp.]|uniref:hypothetical protein n=1 Tax=uncultured Sulfitobacter sp. TaxID=191468 RepID=UPI00262C0105|nr:hypothetical protein [uncultured Sulfitobacter sp.]
MTTPQERRLIIEQAEETLGSVLPDDARARLIETGAFEIKMPEGNPFKLVLSDKARGGALFDDEWGNLLTEMNGWGDPAEYWHFDGGAFIVAENGCGDSYLLAPDAEGVARQLVFADHEIGVWSAILPDIERPWIKPVFVEPEKEKWDDRDGDGILLWKVEQEDEVAPPPIPVATAPSAYPALVFALCAAGTVTVVSMFIGVFLAYRWRQTEPQSTVHYTRQIAFFWRAMIGWGVAFGLLAISVALAKSGSGAEGVVVFKAAVLIAFFAQLAFTIMCLLQSFRLSWGYVAGRSVA